MEEAIAALSLASCILQVIDFGTKVASTAFKVHQTLRRSKEDVDEVSQLRDVYKYLASTLDDIRTQPDRTGPPDTADEGIRKLAKDYSQDYGFSDAKPTGKKLWQAVKNHWRGDEIRSLQKTLGEYRAQLTLSLLMSMREYATRSYSQQETILRQLENGTSHDMSKDRNLSDRIGMSVLEYVTSKLDHQSKSHQRRLLLNDIIHAIQQDSTSPSRDEAWSDELRVSDDLYNQSVHTLLSSLEYKGMKDRANRIPEAHKTTFRWLFQDGNDDKWTNFKNWLQSDDKLYWITGKAGSGKSTLMKYICQPASLHSGRRKPTCREYLEEWSGNKELVIASFYFWNSGIQMQTTQKGLLMSLLRQMIEGCPGLVSFACSNRWETLCLFGYNPPDWEEQELRNVFQLAVKNIGRCGARVALFVDGLDEFQGKPEDLISLFKDIQDYTDFKLCVASRPWTEFEDAFERKPYLRLENLTHDDIKSFVTSKFESEQMFAKLRLRERDFSDQLIELVVSKASGVFLWVTLVVSSLIAGMGFADRVSDLHRRLDMLPPDLTDLYGKMLSSLDPFYLEHAAQLFGLVDASPDPMNLVLASFADEDDSMSALNRNVEVLSDESIRLRIDTMRRRINSRSKGLLEVKGRSSTPHGLDFEISSHSAYTVQYLHRTVKDYIESENVQRTLRSAMESTFDPHLKLLAGHLAYIKGMEIGRVSWQDLWENHFFRCFQHARAVRSEGIPAMVLLLDDLNKVGSTVLENIRQCQNLVPRRLCTWDTGVPTFLREQEGPLTDRPFGRDFLSLAAACNVTEYVQAKAPHEIVHRPLPILMDVLVDGHKYMASLPSRGERDTQAMLSMIRCLLDKGADPKFIMKGPALDCATTSPLIMAVVNLMETDDENWAEIVRLLVRSEKFDRKTLDRSIYDYMERKNLTPPPANLRNFIPLWRLRNAVRDALKDVGRGGNPDFRTLWTKLEAKHILL
ncbi:hypothetical protein B0T10DRAFT_551352 [Thelonectria olida]|uniref:NACHT domain-containing protein n=1 Tax=Thelonectria olida TaxID=1576542 RepID=A0A9P9ALI5_9HYPO|nr:hypothetical protein B0T10DRAFT_551352 [Thelonectria olida]